MCKRCPNINVNLGHIFIMMLFDYVESTTWWFRAISWCWHRSSISNGYISVFRTDPPCLCCADFWDRPMYFSCADCNLSSFVASFHYFWGGWVSLGRRGSKAARLPPWKHLPFENRAVYFPWQKSAVNSVSNQISSPTRACTCEHAGTHTGKHWNTHMHLYHLL